MIFAKVQVSGVHAHAEYRKLIPAGIVGAQVEFEFMDPKWEGLSKTVVFLGYGTKDVLLDGSIAEIPAEVVSREKCRLKVGVYGVNADKTIAIPTLWADLGEIRPAADPSGDPAADPTLPIWAQLQADIKKLQEAAGTSDWDAAEGEPGHILNRPFYSEQSETFILPETSPVYDETDEFFILPDYLPLTAGQEYTVSWNGVEYTRTAWELPMNEDVTVVCLGDAILSDDADPVYLDPFLVGAYPESIVAAMGAGAIIAPMDGSTSLAISIRQTVGVIQRLDNKYLGLDWLPVLVEDEIIPEKQVLALVVGNASYFGEIPDTIGLYDALEVGQTVFVDINGVRHKASVVYDLDGKYIAQYGSDFDPSTTGTIQPIDGHYLIRVLSSRSSAIFETTDPGTYTIRVITGAGNKNKIPEAYLPEDIGATVSQEQIQEAVNAYLEENPLEGGVNFTVDETLTFDPETKVLSVNTARELDPDNTLPITAAAVAATVGNIEILLQTI